MKGYSSAIRDGRDDLCLHKNQPAPFLMNPAPDHEQGSGVSALAQRRRGLNSYNEIKKVSD